MQRTCTAALGQTQGRCTAPRTAYSQLSTQLARASSKRYNGLAWFVYHVRAVELEVQAQNCHTSNGKVYNTWHIMMHCTADTKNKTNTFQKKLAWLAT